MSQLSREASKTAARPSRTRQWIAAAAVALLYILHQDTWFWRTATPLVFGFVPIGLFYHAAYTVATAGALWFIVRIAWPAHLEHE